MNNSKENQTGEWEMLTHKAVPGFRPAFYIILAVAAVYFIYIFSSH